MITKWGSGKDGVLVNDQLMNDRYEGSIYDIYHYQFILCEW